MRGWGSERSPLAKRNKHNFTKDVAGAGAHGVFCGGGGRILSYATDGENYLDDMNKRFDTIHNTTIPAPILRDLHWLPVHQQTKYKIAMLIKSVCGDTPRIWLHEFC